MRRARIAFVAAVCVWHAAAVCLAGGMVWGAVGDEVEDLEWLVAHVPGSCELRVRLAKAYEEIGLVEEAVEQYLEVLARKPEDEEARAGAKALVEKRMPVWLPGNAARAAPFNTAVLDLELTEEGGVGRPRPTEAGVKELTYRLLVTEEGFAAREGERWDEVHERGLAWIEYGYVWEAEQKRWVMRVRVHWAEPDDGQLAQEALRATLAFYCVTREYLACDPTQPGGEPVDVWLGNRGRPGARAVGRNLYLYSVKTPRSPAEWVRQVAHEYGHIALPGIGGFTETDDPWADGHLGELLFPKWLAASGVPEWMPWSVEEWEREATGRREALMAAARGVADVERVGGTDEAARDYFLGLALRVEEVAGPRLLGEALRQCPRGSARQFVAAVGRLAKQQGSEESGELFRD